MFSISGGRASVVKRAGVPVLVAAAIFAGCNAETEPATNVTSSSFLAHSKVDCDVGERIVDLTWEVREQGGTWADDGAPYDPIVCAATVTDYDLTHTYSGLDPGTVYEYRLCGSREASGGHPAGGPFCATSTQLVPPTYTPATYDTAVTAVPSGTLVKQDTITSSNVLPFWGQWSTEGTTVGSPGSGTIDYNTSGGPVSEGGWRRLHIPAGDRRNEVGQVNEDTGIAYEVEDEYLTRQWYRLPDLVFGDDGSERGAMMQMKHASDEDGDLHGGFGGSPVSSGPPLALKRTGTNEVELVERSGDYPGNVVWSDTVPTDTWIEFSLQVTYSLTQGHVTLYYRELGDEPVQVYNDDIPTIKENTDGDPMYSTFRVGLYPGTPPLEEDTYVDIGPSAVYELP